MRIFSKIYIVSHARERAEKICLNCNTELAGRYCHVCGQENIEPRESIWGVITHFFNDITHFDGKFFKTVGKLIARPGLLPLEYINGRRADYLHPIRLYVFTSAVFFLVFYTVWTPAIKNMVAQNTKTEVTPNEVPSLKDVVRKPMDSIGAVYDREAEYRSLEAYDSSQQTLPAAERDGWFTQKVTKGFIKRSIQYDGKGEGIRDSIIEDFTHKLPYLLFVSLPICALFLTLLFFRNKNNLYAGNAIFLVYLYVFTFLMLLVYILFGYLKTAYHMGWLEWVRILLLLYIFYYAAKAMRRYYGQGRFITFLKFMVYNFLALVTVFCLFIMFLLLSVM
ncbi:MAG: DUF3667 domain-containing protein [Chitinophagaceae bacterium]|nr:MAG: DUF3667 domain-containing protein [Chitinophagaceae bacterium]